MFYGLLDFLQELKEEVSQKESALEKLSQRYSQLAVDDPHLVDRHIRPLQAAHSSLLADINEHITARKAFLTKCRSYHKQHTDMNSSIDDAISSLKWVKETDEIPLEQRIAHLKVG